MENCVYKKDECLSISIIQELVSDTHSSLNKEDGYLVFGAIGNTFIVEIAQGSVEKRNILKTFYIDIKHDLQTEILIKGNPYTYE